MQQCVCVAVTEATLMTNPTRRLLEICCRAVLGSDQLHTNPNLLYKLKLGMPRSNKDSLFRSIQCL
jgi:hypothetical protein